MTNPLRRRYVVIDHHSGRVLGRFYRLNPASACSIAYTRSGFVGSIELR